MFFYLALILAMTSCTSLSKSNKARDFQKQKEIVQAIIKKDIAQKHSHAGKTYWASFDLYPLINGDPFKIATETILIQPDFFQVIDESCKKDSDQVTVYAKNVLTLDQKSTEGRELFIYQPFRYIINCGDIKQANLSQELKMDKTDAGYFRHGRFYRDDASSDLSRVELIDEDPLANYRHDENIVMAVRENRIYKGMPAHLVEVAWGKADYINIIPTSKLTFKQYVYEEATSVYTDGFFIIEWEESN